MSGRRGVIVLSKHSDGMYALSLLASISAAATFDPAEELKLGGAFWLGKRVYLLKCWSGG